MIEHHSPEHASPERRPGIGGRMWMAVAPYLVSLLLAVVLLALLEGLLRAFWPQDPRQVTADRTTHRPVTWGIPDSVLGHRLRPNTRTVESNPEFTALYFTDADGFRTDSAAPPVPSAGAAAPRVLIIGDSFAFGYGVAWPETWAVRTARYLREAGTPVEIVNTGTPGYDTRSEALMLEQTITRYRPTVVLMMFLPNDLFTNLPIAHSEASREAVVQRVNEIGGNKFGGLHSVVLAKRLAMKIDRAYCNLYLITPRKEYFVLPRSALVRTQLEVTEQLLSRAASVSREHGARFVVLSVPQLFQVLHVANGYEFAGVDSHWIDREFAAYAQRTGFTWLPTLDRLAELHRKGGAENYYRFDGHLDAAGEAVVARLLAESGTLTAAPAGAH